MTRGQSGLGVWIGEQGLEMIGDPTKLSGEGTPSPFECLPTSGPSADPDTVEEPSPGLCHQGAAYLLKRQPYPDIRSFLTA